MTKAPRMHTVNIHLKQTGFDNFSGRQCCCFARRLCSRRNGKTCLLAEQVFMSTCFCCWKYITVDSEFFVLSTLEKCHQISLSGPWSATYDLGWIKLPKIKSDSLCFWRMFWKSSLYMSTSSPFLIPRIHTEFLVIIFDRAENRSSTLVWETRGDCCLKSLKEKQIILCSQHLPKKTLA